MKYYLAGPMTGYKKFNFPLFTRVTTGLRAIGYDITSPVVTDEPDMQEIAWKSPDGKHDEKFKETWGEVLAKDVLLIADEMESIIVLPNWNKSKGARLEVFVAVLCGYPIYTVNPETLNLRKISNKTIMEKISVSIL